MSRRIIVFAKTPRPGRVKTRLCPPLSPEQAAELARAFLLDVLSLCEGLPGYERSLAYSPRGTRGEMAVLAGSGWRLMLQRGRGLGDRLANAFEQTFREAAARVLIVGTDMPHLPVATLREADAALQSADMVLGPSEDGGFYLIGLRRWARGLLDEVRWSTEHALADTVARGEDLGLSYELLRRGYDIDEFADLLRLARERRTLSRALKNTRRAIGAIDVEGLARQSGRPGASR
jgi:rSAM/selenodomain-associated transferase 1